jgi:hypothetical protein
MQKKESIVRNCENGFQPVMQMFYTAGNDRVGGNKKGQNIKMLPRI